MYGMWSEGTLYMAWLATGNKLDHSTASPICQMKFIGTMQGPKYKVLTERTCSHGQHAWSWAWAI